MSSRASCSARSGPTPHKVVTGAESGEGFGSGGVIGWHNTNRQKRPQRESSPERSQSGVREKPHRETEAVSSGATSHHRHSPQNVAPASRGPYRRLPVGLASENGTGQQCASPTGRPE